MSTATHSLQQRFLNLKNNRWFEALVISIIIISALLIGARTYSVEPGWAKLLTVMDYSITLFFLVELSIRFWAEENKRAFFKNGWNIFDTLIVLISIIPMANGDMALLGRLIRIFRVLRMVSIIPELRILLNSLIKALPQLGYVVILMFIIFYIYAAVGSTLFHSINEVLWGDISISLLTLFRVMTFEDWTDVMYETMAVYPLSWTFYLSFIFFTAFAFLNMVIGIVVNVMEEENRKAYAEEHKYDPTLEDVMAELKQIKQQLQN
ncbi:MAG: ion transporter [Arenicellales bacterium]